MSFLSELWAFMWVRKKFWLLPALLALVLFGILIIFGHGTVLAPFVYTLF